MIILCNYAMKVIRGIPERIKPFVMPAWFPDYYVIKARYRNTEWATIFISNGKRTRRFYILDEHYYFTIADTLEIACNDRCP